MPNELKSVATHSPFLGLKSGIGIVITNMIGVGIFISTGFMAQNMGPKLILISWMIGALIAFWGAMAYAQLAMASGKSGGEYRYLHDFLHPYIGYLAGWASLLIGFTAPIAVDAYVAGAFLAQLFDGISPQLVGVFAIITLSIGHGIELKWSKAVQNTLFSMKFFLLLGFIFVGISFGNNVWPTWVPPNAKGLFNLNNFIENQYWIAFAFSGWNAAIYAAGEFDNPKRDVSRSIIIGLIIVAIIYFLINWVFIANLSPNQALVVTQHEATNITLAHLVMGNLIGPIGAKVFSMIMVIVFMSALSAMILTGPRVYAAMADDGLLPRVFKSRKGAPPSTSIIFQAGVALFLIYTQTVLEIVKSASAILMVFSMLTVLTMFNLTNKIDFKPSRLSQTAAILYVISVLVILFYGAFSSSSIIITILAIFFIGSTSYLLNKRNT